MKALFCADNRLTVIDISNCTRLVEMVEDSEPVQANAGFGNALIWVNKQELADNLNMIFLITDKDVVPYTGAGK